MENKKESFFNIFHYSNSSNSLIGSPFTLKIQSRWVTQDEDVFNCDFSELPDSLDSITLRWETKRKNTEEKKEQWRQKKKKGEGVEKEQMKMRRNTKEKWNKKQMNKDQKKGNKRKIEKNVKKLN